MWSLERLTPRLYASLAALGARLAAGLADAARDAGVALQVNAFGSLLTPFFTDRPVRDYASATSADTGRYAAFFRGMLARGVYPPPSQFEAWFLSAAHTREGRRSNDRCGEGSDAGRVETRQGHKGTEDTKGQRQGLVAPLSSVSFVPLCVLCARALSR